MKKKVWVSSPYMLVALVIMAIMTVGSFYGRGPWFFINLGLTTLFAVSFLTLRIQFQSYINTTLKSSAKVLTAQNEYYLNELALPIVVCGLNADIVWANAGFLKNIALNGSKVVGDSIEKYLNPKSINQIEGEKKSNIMYNGKQYTVYCVKTKDSYVLYFVDDTYLKEIHKEYTNKKTVVAIVAFDNREEVIRDATGGDESRITSEVEGAIRDWSSEFMGGFMRKLSGGRYLVITDEFHIQKAKERRFEVLDSVRKIEGVNGINATISMGIGTNTPTAVESEKLARQALDMSLGRGGDQVTIMQSDNKYEFFGGLSKGVEKRDKVRTRVIASSLSERIKASDKVLVMGHKFSDLDSVGSCVGVWAIAKKALLKQSHIVIDKNQSLATPVINSMISAYPDSKVFISPQEALSEITPKTLLVITDTHSFSFVESEELLKQAKTVVVIDHHRMMVTHIKNAIIFYHEPYASSASEMVAELAPYIDANAIGNIEAQALLAGIMLDTKNFVLKTSVRTFEAAALLKRRGADTVKVKKLFANSFATYREKSELIANAEIFDGYAVSCAEGFTQNTRVAAAQVADELLSIQGVKASFVLFEANNAINISGRSFGEINVQVILENFGGGGHLTMAGAQVKDKDMFDVRKELIDVIKENDDRLK